MGNSSMSKENEEGRRPGIEFANRSSSSFGMKFVGEIQIRGSKQPTTHTHTQTNKQKDLS